MSADEADSFNLAYKAAKEVLEMCRGKFDEMYVVQWFGRFNVATAGEITGEAMYQYYQLTDLVAAVRETIN